jgi:hypothetical protein
MAYAEGVIDCPICGKALTQRFTTQVAPNPDPDRKPEAAECIGDPSHRFPVLDVSITSGGQQTYTLAPPETTD